MTPLPLPGALQGTQDLPPGPVWPGEGSAVELGSLQTLLTASDSASGSLGPRDCQPGTALAMATSAPHLARHLLRLGSLGQGEARTWYQASADFYTLKGEVVGPPAWIHIQQSHF